jgi:signal transduction histidine kinase
LETTSGTLTRPETNNLLAEPGKIVDPRSILIISDDSSFPQQITSRWRDEFSTPRFAISRNLDHSIDPDVFDLFIVGPGAPSALKRVIRALDAGLPVIFVATSVDQAEPLREELPRLLAVPQHDGWADIVVILAGEILRRMDAVARADRTEIVNSHLKRNATLGQYVLDMRHGMNNALTSVLGNAELLLLEPGAFSATVQSQLDTIRNMALRLHEILQRFSSLEKELIFMERHEAREKSNAIQIAAGQ